MSAALYTEELTAAFVAASPAPRDGGEADTLARTMPPIYLDRLANDGVGCDAFAVIGDTQRSMGYQKLLGRERDNDAERRALVRDIELRGASCVVLAGDLVTYGQFATDWEYFDDVMAPLRARDVTTLPVMGNHDYFVRRDSALIHLRARFPRLDASSWYVTRIGPIALVVLDSNRGPLGRALWNAQREWLAALARTLDADPSVKGVVLCGHHPPFTNSWEVGPHGPTRRDVLPLFHGMRKAIAYVSGHCHAYERFEERGRTFLVTGGGGGPRQPLRRGMFARSRDRYPGGVLRPFHYLWLRATGDGIDVEVRGLDKGEAMVRPLEEFTMRWPSP